jgi:3-hydroxybutyryl-CoA dehydrogenase
MDPITVGVIGAGVIGAGVAQALAEAGHRVIVVDLSCAILDRCRDTIAQAVRLQRLFRKGSQPADADLLTRITFTTGTAQVVEARFVIENVTEKWEIKRGLYQEIDRICTADTIFAANTSAIPITRIAGATNRPDRVIGIHFMNPVPLKPMVEVIRGHHTSDETLDRAAALIRSMGKDFVVVGDSPGFVSNRVLMLTINEAICLLHENVSSAADVDRIFTSCFGHKMGPLATADLIGLDTILNSIEVLNECFRDAKYRPCPLLSQMVDAGLLGCKSGRGFYSYQTAG